ncbi:hypothetical protein HY087_02475 [Candidatus Gottesmanbacteria bacterium]|nr:hypothetical protein [Candidatus Gottesmanbacteria bacterium]
MMKMVNKYCEGIIVSVIAILTAFFNLFHVFYWALKTPPHTIFIGITHWYEDYFFYLSGLTQGAAGAWKLKNLYTLEAIPLGFSWIFNLVLGRIAALISLPVWTTYDGTIFFLSLVYVLTAFMVLTRIFPHQPGKRLGALVIAITSTHFFAIEKSALGGVTFVPITYFYAYTAAFNRFGGVAHHVAQNILSVGSLVLLANLINNLASYPTNRTILLSAGLSLVLSLLFTMSSFYVAVNVGVFCLAVGLMRVLYGRPIRMKTLAISLGIILVPLMWLGLTQGAILSHPFWQQVRVWETTRTPTSLSTFILSMGMITPFLLLGVRRYLRTPSAIRVVGFLYAFVPVILYVTNVSERVGIPSFRLLQPGAYVVFGAVAMEGMESIARRFKPRNSRAVLVLILIVYTLLQLPGLVAEIQKRTNEYYLNSHLNFLKADVYEGLMFLSRQPKNKAVLAVHTLESFVPVVSGFAVYEGHATITMDYKSKIEKTIAFYYRKIRPEDAKKLLSTNNIGYVLWEKRFGDAGILSDYYPFLQKYYENPALVIFTIQ